MTFKPLNEDDITNTRTLLHEAIPLTGTILSGTYGAFGSEANIKNYSHGMFQSTYDYPYLSSSANHLFDVTCGFDEGAAVTGSAQTLSASARYSGVQVAKKINMYNQFSQVLLGYTGSNNTVEIFESDLNISDNTAQMTSCYFVTLSRLLMKEQIKKGTFSMTLGTGSHRNAGANYPIMSAYSITLIDASASSGDSGGYKSGLPGGDYGVLYVSGSQYSTTGIAVGNIWYQAGVIVLTSSVFGTGSTGAPRQPNQIPTAIVSESMGGATYTAIQTMVTGTITGSCDIVRERIQNISFNNTTEINHNHVSGEKWRRRRLQQRQRQRQQQYRY